MIKTETKKPYKKPARQTYTCQKEICDGGGVVILQQKNDIVLKLKDNKAMIEIIEFAYRCPCEAGPEGLEMFQGLYQLPRGKELTEWQKEVINSYKLKRKKDINRKDWG